MLIGAAFIALGFILMTGGGSDDPNVFNPEIYNWRRKNWDLVWLVPKRGGCIKLDGS